MTLLVTIGEAHPVQATPTAAAESQKKRVTVKASARVCVKSGSTRKCHTSKRSATATTKKKAKAKAATLANKAAKKRAKRAAKRADLRKEIVREAKKHLGKPYRNAATGPKSFDCSGFIQYVVKRTAKKTIVAYTYGQWELLSKQRVSKKSKLRAGDLVYYFKNGNHHAGIYIGKGRTIEARSGLGKVGYGNINQSWWKQNYTGGARVVNFLVQ